MVSNQVLLFLILQRIEEKVKSDKKIQQSTSKVLKKYWKSKQKVSETSWVLEAQSEMLRTPQNVPAWTVSWPDDPV